MGLEDLNLRNSIKIGYYDPFSVFPTVELEFLSRFPLANLHWKYHPLKPVKSIPLLPVQLQEEVPSKNHGSKHFGRNVAFDNVYLRLIFVKAENMDIYRSQVRPLIEAWLSQLVIPSNVHWTIILVLPGSKMDKPSTLIKTSIYDKLIMDFGASGKHVTKLKDAAKPDTFDLDEEQEYVLKIKQSYPDDITKLQEYNHVIARMKTLLLQTFDFRYNNFNDETERLQKIAQNDTEALVALLLNKLNVMYTLSDMRFLTESLEVYLEVADDLKVLVKRARHAFDTESCPLPERIDHSGEFLSQHEANLPVLQFSAYTAQNTPINLFLTKLGLFVSASLLLHSLANFATSVSVSSIHLLSLLQKLMLFINDVSQSYPNTTQINEWLCSVIDFYLGLPLTKKLLEISHQNRDENGPINVAEILEYTAELQLLKRSILGKLAIAKGLELPEAGLFLEDISLDSDSDSDSKLKEIKLTYTLLIDQLLNQESYETAFEELTVSAIQDFASCNRIRTIDLLSIDLAILHYRRKEYKEAFDILLSSHDYFIQHGWKFMGGMLLEIYLECLENLDVTDHEELLMTHLKLFASLKTTRATETGINSYGLIKNERQRLQIFQTICATSIMLEEPFVFPLDALFTVHANPFIEASSESQEDEYTVKVEIENNFSIDIQISEIEVRLVDVSTGLELVFSAQEIVLKRNQNDLYWVKTPIFRKGKYELASVTLKATEKLHFVEKSKSIADKTIQDETVLRHGVDVTENQGNTSETESPQEYFHMYPDINKLHMEVSKPARIEMGNSSLLVTLHNGHSDIENVKVKISNATSGLEIDPEHCTSAVKSLPSRGNWSKVVPFTYFGESKTLQLDFDVWYQVNGRNFEHHISLTHDTSLTIAISVQDIFRRTSLYSKFQIARADEGKPVRVLGSCFKSPDNKYEVSTATEPDGKFEPLLVFGEQPAYLFYRVEPKQEMKSSDSLDLTLTYSDLQQECEEAVKQRLWDALDRDNLQKYFFVVEAEMPEMRFDFTAYSFYGRVVVRNIHDCAEQLRASLENYVPSAENRRSLVTALNKAAQDITLDDQEQFYRRQELYISVAVPFLGMLHLVNIEFDRKAQYYVGEPIEARLCIDSTPKWKSRISSPILASLSPVGKASPPCQSYQYSLVHEDNWIVSGFMKQDFEVDENGDRNEFSVTLVPLNVGELQLPKVTVIPNSAYEQNMDVVNENALETVLVVPELNSITFSF